MRAQLTVVVVLMTEFRVVESLAAVALSTLFPGMSRHIGCATHQLNQPLISYNLLRPMLVGKVDGRDAPQHASSPSGRPPSVRRRTQRTNGRSRRCQAQHHHNTGTEPLKLYTIYAPPSRSRPTAAVVRVRHSCPRTPADRIVRVARNITRAERRSASICSTAH